MLIVFPLGLLSTAVIFDVLFLITDKAGFSTSAAYMMAAGVISAPIAAAFGWADWSKIPSRTQAKSIGLIHGIGNMLVALLFFASWLLRSGEPAWRPPTTALVLSFAGVVVAIGTAWLGGELVERLGVGVDDDADLNAPSSLSKQPHGRAPQAAR
jgi:uncharacterized membrane protein